MTSVSGMNRAGDYGALSRLIDSSLTIHDRLDKLTLQASSGLIADTYAGLGTGAAVSLNLHPQIAQLKTWQGNIDTATARMTVAQSALTQLQQITTTFIANTNKLNGSDAASVATLAASARDALTQVAGLLNTQDGTGAYVFAGEDTANPPVPNPDAIASSGFAAQIGSAVAQLASLGGAGVAAATLATASSNVSGTSPFSTYLSQPVANLQAPVVRIGEHRTATVGLFASGNAIIASTGTSTTGSYARDLMRALATIGSLSGSQANDPNLPALVRDTGASLQGALTAMASEAGAFGDRQANLATVNSGLADTQTALAAQLGSAEDADLASTLAQLSAVQTQLQASYQLISGANNLSLAKYLGAG